MLNPGSPGVLIGSLPQQITFKARLIITPALQLEPFRASFDELAKTVKETLEAKLMKLAALIKANPKDKDKVGLDIKKVYELYEGKGERKLNCDPELELLAKQLFEMVIMISSSMYLGNAVVTKTIGTNFPRTSKTS